jgi:hypothetical protein
VSALIEPGPRGGRANQNVLSTRTYLHHARLNGANAERTSRNATSIIVHIPRRPEDFDFAASAQSVS